MSDRLLHYFQEKAGISNEDFDTLRPFIKDLLIQKGTILLHPGDICSDLFFVSSGCLRSYIMDNKGKEYILQFAPENWWISDLNSFLNCEPAILCIETIELSKVIIFPHDLYETLEVKQPKINNLFQQLLQNNNLAIQKRLISSLSATAQVRYEEFIHSHPNLALRLPQHMIASYLGIAPESLSRLRKKVATG